MKVSEYIKALRTQKGISQEELGKFVGVQRAAVQKWESGATQNLKRTTIQKLAQYFDVSPAGFVDDDFANNIIVKEELSLLNKYNQLNDFGKKKADEYISDLLTMDKYRSDISLEDEEDYDDAETASYMAAFSGGINHKGPKADIDDIKELNSMAENEDE